MIPTPILSALTTLHSHRVPVLLLGGQATILYGGAEFSRDLDLLLAATPETLVSLQKALADLNAEPIAVPPLNLDLLIRGHAAHFRCRRTDVAGLRLDVMTNPPRITDVAAAWDRGITVDIGELPLRVMALPDLIQTKKTQRDKDWAVIGALVRADMVRHPSAAPQERALWFRESRETADLLALAAAYPEEAAEAELGRPLLGAARKGDAAALEVELAGEQIQGKQADRDYWAPIRAELERMRFDQRRS